MYFAFFSIGLLLIAALGWMRGILDVWAVAALVSFIAANLVVSQISLRVSHAHMVRLEFFRIFVMNNALCGLIYVTFEGPLFELWEVYLIPVIGGTFMIGVSSPHPLYPRVAPFYWAASVGAVIALSSHDPTVYNVAVPVLSIALISVITIKYSTVLGDSTEREMSRADELENALDELRATRAQLVQSERMAALGEMAGGVSHEINTPLATIQMNADFVQTLLRESRPALDERAETIAKSAATIASTAMRIAQITQALRDFSRDASRDVTETVPAAALVDSALLLCQERIKNASVTLSLAPALATVFVSCRRVQIVQALFNLLQNSFDALVDTRDKWISIESWSLEADTAAISVTDSGRGIPESARKELFEPVFATTELGRGISLGLSIARALVENNGGSLDLDVDSPHTRFVLTLPADFLQRQVPGGTSNLGG